MSKKTPVCDRGFLTAIKRFPKKNIQHITEYANEVCNGRIADIYGEKKSSPFHSVKVRTQAAPEATIRPLFPQYEELYASVPGEPVIVDQYIIGVTDSNGDLLLCRPKSIKQYLK